MSPYQAPEAPPAAPRLDYPYPHQSSGYNVQHPPHDGSCVDFDGWKSPWELPELRFDFLEDL